MEHEECNYYCEQKKKPKKVSCLGIIAVILIAFLSFVLGTILGALISTTILGALSAIIVLAIILALLLLITIIFAFCKSQKQNKHCC